MIFLILGILFLAIGIPASSYYKHVESLRDEEKPFIAQYPGFNLYSIGGCLVMLLDVLGVVFIIIFIVKTLT